MRPHHGVDPLLGAGVVHFHDAAIPIEVVCPLGNDRDDARLGDVASVERVKCRRDIRDASVVALIDAHVLRNQDILPIAASSDRLTPP
jgi:hypothetical protein